MNTFGKSIKTARLDFKWTLNDVSMKLGIDNAIVSKIQRGLRRATRKQVQILIEG